VTAPTAEEVSAAPAAGEGSGTSVAGEGSGTSAVGEGFATSAAGVGFDTGIITTSRPPDNGGGTKSSSKTTTTSAPLGSVVCWSSRARRAADRELEPTVSSRAVARGCRDDDTSVPWGGDDEDDPDMSLQSSAALATLPLHDSSGDGSSSEETPSFPAFRLLMRLSF
jgi:hypothetical protein